VNGSYEKIRVENFLFPKIVRIDTVRIRSPANTFLWYDRFRGELNLFSGSIPALIFCDLNKDRAIGAEETIPRLADANNASRNKAGKGINEASVTNRKAAGNLFSFLNGHHATHT